MSGFTDENDLLTFEGWIEYQAADISTPEQLAEWRKIYQEIRAQTESMPPLGRMNIKQLAGAHTSYHRDGTFHMKSYDRKMLTPEKRQPTDNLRGVEPLGTFYGYGPKSVGAICEPSQFTGIVQVPRGVLGPRDGGISVSLMEPNQIAPKSPFEDIVAEQVFTEVVPWIVITVGR